VLAFSPFVIVLSPFCFALSHPTSCGYRACFFWSHLPVFATPRHGGPLSAPLFVSLTSSLIPFITCFLPSVIPMDSIPMFSFFPLRPAQYNHYPLLCPHYIYLHIDFSSCLLSVPHRPPCNLRSLVIVPFLFFSPYPVFIFFGLMSCFAFSPLLFFFHFYPINYFVFFPFSLLVHHLFPVPPRIICSTPFFPLQTPPLFRLLRRNPFSPSFPPAHWRHLFNYSA